MMRSILLVSSLIISSTALAAPKSIKYDYARVEHVQRVYEQPSSHTYHKNCHSAARHTNSAASTLLGAMIGGAIGNAIGQNGSQKKLSTLAGAALGGSIAHELSGRHNPQTHCTYTESHKPRFIGYKVSYRYKGERFHTMMAKRPGNKIKIQVTHTLLNR